MVHMCRKMCTALAVLSLVWAVACEGERAHWSAAREGGREWVAAANSERLHEVAVPMQLYGVYDRDVAVGDDPSQLTIPPGILDSSWIRELRSRQLAAAAQPGASPLFGTTLRPYVERRSGYDSGR